MELFLFIDEKYSLLWVCHNLAIHSFIEGYTVRLQCLLPIKLLLIFVYKHALTLKNFLKPCKYAIADPFIVTSDLPIPSLLPVLSNELIYTIFIFPFYNPVIIPGIFIFKNLP